MNDNNKESIAILGGTGDLGTGLARRWARAGYPVIIGSRSLDKATVAVTKLRQIQVDINVLAMPNTEAAKMGDILVLTVPYAHQINTLEAVREWTTGKILIDTTVPLKPPKVGTVQLPDTGSAVAYAQKFLGAKTHVVGAFQNVAADLLQQDKKIDCDVLVTGNNKNARQKVLTLVTAAGMRGWHAGPIANSVAAEALTSVLIQINRQSGAGHAGIRITGGIDPASTND